MENPGMLLGEILGNPLCTFDGETTISSNALTHDEQLVGWPLHPFRLGPDACEPAAGRVLGEVLDTDGQTGCCFHCPKI